MAAAEGKESTDIPAKNFFARKEILCNILKYAVAEYKDESLEKIMEHIEGDTIQTGTALVSEDMAQSIRGERTQTWTINEASAEFDIVFRSLLPQVDGRVAVNLHIDFEIQKDYDTMYPLVKRGVYYAVRQLSAQLPKIGKNGVGYSGLEKVYSIWVCVENIPRDLQNTVSFYKLQNYRNDSFESHTVLHEDKECDLIEVVIIRLGAKSINERGLLDMLYGLFEGNKEKVFSYLPETASTEFIKEADEMLSMITYAEEKGTKKGIKEGKKEGVDLCAAILKILRKNPSSNNADVAKEIGCSEEEIAEVRKSLDI